MRKIWQSWLYSRRRLRELYESAMAISERRRREFEALRSLHKLLVVAYEDTRTELAVLHLGHSRLREEAAKLRDALTSLSGCMPDRIYIYGNCGEYWAEREPDQDDWDEFETIDFAELLGAGEGE